jgi:hypothetical protein
LDQRRSLRFTCAWRNSPSTFNLRSVTFPARPNFDAAGLAIGGGARAIVLTNQKGAVLEIEWPQVGLMANAD